MRISDWSSDVCSSDLFAATDAGTDAFDGDAHLLRAAPDIGRRPRPGAAVQRIAENAADGDAVEATGRDRRIRRIRAGLDGAGGQWSLVGLQDVLQAWKPNADRKSTSLNSSH